MSANVRLTPRFTSAKDRSDRATAADVVMSAVPPAWRLIQTRRPSSITRVGHRLLGSPVKSPTESARDATQPNRTGNRIVDELHCRCRRQAESHLSELIRQLCLKSVLAIPIKGRKVVNVEGKLCPLFRRQHNIFAESTGISQLEINIRPWIGNVNDDEG